MQSEPRDIPRPATERAFWATLAVVGLLHASLFFWSLARPDNYLQGDRAAQRLRKTQRLLESDDFLEALTHTGGPGDYLFHAMLWAVGGATLTLLAQVLLLLLSVAALYWLARSVSIPAWASAAACLAYVLLPNNIHQPHTLVTEAFSTPFVLFAFCFLARCLLGGRSATRDVVLFGLFAGLASFTRPVFLAVAPLLALFLFANGRRAWRSFVLANVVALLMPLAWAMVQVEQTGRLELGGRGFTLEANLLGRMERMRAAGGGPLPESSVEEEAAELPAFLGYAGRNPLPLLTTVAVDGFHLVLNTGINHVGGRFFGWFDISEDWHYWRRLHDEKGLAGLLEELLRSGSTMIALNVVALVLWVSLLGVAAVGAVSMCRGPDRVLAWSLLTLSGAVALSSLAALAVRFGMRSAMEFALAIFFASGLTVLHHSWQRR